jgi:hypothetical protein
MSAPVVPDSHKTLPPTPDDSKATQTAETDPSVLKTARKVARNKLAEKNRKQHQFRIETPIMLGVEAGLTYQMKGFQKDADNVNWICTSMEIELSGKKGSEVKLELQRALDF